MTTDYKRAKNIVSQILRLHPDTRDSDKKLLLKAMEYQGLFLTAEQQQAFMQCIPSESITRARRNIQEKGEYIASDGIKRKRMMNEVKMREIMWKDGKPYIID